MLKKCYKKKLLFMLGKRNLKAEGHKIAPGQDYYLNNF